MKTLLRLRIFPTACLAVVFCLTAFGGTPVNGDFETGNASGWTIGGGSRASLLNGSLLPSLFLPGGAYYDFAIASTHSGIVTPGLDANTGNQLNRVYSGNYSWRVEDTTNGGYASVISQTILNYTKPDFFFAWAAVLEGAHGPTDAATVVITLRDVTAGADLITRQYNAGGGVDARFSYNSSTNYYWTPWQIEQLTLPSGAVGHDLTLTVLAADCQPTGHTGYLYLDGFGSSAPIAGGQTASAAPSLSEWGMALLAGGLIFVAVRRLRKPAAPGLQ
jgi:hypothetical protein